MFETKRLTTSPHHPHTHSQGNQKLSQTMMRWRVTAQAATVGIMLASAGGAAAAQAWEGGRSGGKREG